MKLTYHSAAPLRITKTLYKYEAISNILGRDGKTAGMNVSAYFLHQCRESFEFLGKGFVVLKRKAIDFVNGNTLLLPI